MTHISEFIVDHSLRANPMKMKRWNFRANDHQKSGKILLLQIQRYIFRGMAKSGRDSVGRFPSVSIFWPTNGYGTSKNKGPISETPENDGWIGKSAWQWKISWLIGSQWKSILCLRKPTSTKDDRFSQWLLSLQCLCRYIKSNQVYFSVRCGISY